MRRGSSGVLDRRSSAPVRRGSGWSLAGLLGKDNDNGSKHGIDDDKSTMTSHDSLSSMFEEEDMWKEFKAELETSKVHTSAGVQVRKSNILWGLVQFIDQYYMYIKSCSMYSWRDRVVNAVLLPTFFVF